VQRKASAKTLPCRPLRSPARKIECRRSNQYQNAIKLLKSAEKTLQGMLVSRGVGSTPAAPGPMGSLPLPSRSKSYKPQPSVDPGRSMTDGSQQRTFQAEMMRRGQLVRRTLFRLLRLSESFRRSRRGLRWEPRHSRKGHPCLFMSMFSRVRGEHQQVEELTTQMTRHRRANSAARSCKMEKLGCAFPDIPP